MVKLLEKIQVNWKLPAVLLGKIRAEAARLGYGTITAFVVQVFIDYFKERGK